MKNADKTKVQMLQELEALRQRVSELEAVEAECQRAKAALADAGRKCNKLFEHAGESIFFVDPVSLRFLEVNSHAARRLGYTKDELLQLTLDDVEVLDPKGYTQAVAWESTVSGTAFYECDYRHKDGSKIPVEVSSRLVHYGQQEVMLNFVRDITRRKQVEEELRAYDYTVAHDLKGPLANMMAYAEFLEIECATLPTEEIQECARSIVQIGRQLCNVVDELLLFAGVRDAEAKVGPLPMANLVATACDRLTYLIKDSEAQIIQPHSWPEAVGYGPWIEEVWTNYLSNAIKFGGKPPRVELGFDANVKSLGAAARQQEWICFWVRDNGLGLTAEEQARVFAPFERLGQVEISGHGLGLSIVQRIIEKLGGQVGVQSEGVPGRGCTFFFVLPRAS